MTPRRWAWLLAAAVAAYLVLAGVRGWALLTSGQATGVLLGIAVFALPVVGAWVVWREISFGYAMQAMGAQLRFVIVRNILAVEQDAARAGPLQ